MKLKKLVKNIKSLIFSEILSTIVLVCFASNLLFPQIAEAKTAEKVRAEDIIIQPSPITVIEPESSKFTNHLPEIPGPRVRRTTYITATAYSSTVDQCDSTPCIAAKGFNLCKHNKENVIASNYLPIGAKVRFPELYGDKIFTVQDRMNARYYKRIDFWMKTRQKAKNFGLKYVKMEIL